MSSLPLQQASHPDQPQRVLVVEFEANDGSRWHALGGGGALEEALAFARESTPNEYWRVARISDLYGE